MSKYHITIMSEDPNDHSEDPHQKYGSEVDADNETDALKKGEEQFKQEFPNLPIYWVKAYKQ